MTPILSGAGAWACASGDQAHGGQTGDGNGRAYMTNRFTNSHTLNPPKANATPRNAPKYLATA